MDIRYCLILRTSVKQFKISYNTGGYFYCLTRRTSVRSIQNNEHTTHLAYSIKSLHHTPDNLANIFGSYFPAIQHATLNVTHVWWNIGKVSRNKTQIRVHPHIFLDRQGMITIPISLPIKAESCRSLIKERRKVAPAQ